MVTRATRVEVCRASGARHTAIEVFGNAQNPATGTAQHRFGIAAANGPRHGGMVGDRLVACETRHPKPAAPHAQGDYIGRPSPVRAASTDIDVDPLDGHPVDTPHAAGPATRQPSTASVASPHRVFLTSPSTGLPSSRPDCDNSTAGCAGARIGRAAAWSFSCRIR